MIIIEKNREGLVVVKQGAQTNLIIQDTRIPEISAYDAWEQLAYPLGNGNIGAGVFGGVHRERLQLNEKTLWSGGPGPNRDYQGGNLIAAGKHGETLRQAQRLFVAGQVEAALRLCDTLVGVADGDGTQGYGFYLSFGNIYLEFDYGMQSEPTRYDRRLNLDTATATVQYQINDLQIVRECFISYPDQVLVTRIRVLNGVLPRLRIVMEPDNQPGDAGPYVTNGSYQRTWNTQVTQDTIAVDGYLLDNQLHFTGYTKIFSNGRRYSDQTAVSVENAGTILILTSMGTDYQGVYPHYRTGESAEALSRRVRGYVERAGTDFDLIYQRHLQDYQALYRRVSLLLGDASPSAVPTHLLLARYQDGTASAAERQYLETLLFQYGRYLTIAGSRETPPDDPFRAQLPTNLQGMWVGANNSIWHADYHLNVNLQMNYWPTMITNLAECARPLLDYVDGLRAPGRVTAAVYAGIVSDADHPENGFMAHTQNNPFGWTCPGWHFSWGWSPAAVPWILRNCYEYYLYTQDRDLLSKQIYPMMREAARFYDQFLVEDQDGCLVSAPSYSPEHGPYTAGNTYEHSLIWQLYHDTMEAAQTLGVDADLVALWGKMQSLLKGPIQIGAAGQIKEWYEETTLGSMPNTEADHRHASHLLGLYPGDLINPQTPDYRAAAAVSLDTRGVPSTGWGRAQRVLCYDRLGMGDAAYGMLSGMIRQVVYDNLFFTHPPFQIDANYGYTAGVAEMLLQSDGRNLYLLPALPSCWSSGQVTGLMAKGNFEVSLVWQQGAVTAVRIQSNRGGTVTVCYPDGHQQVLHTAPGQVYVLPDSL